MPTDDERARAVARFNQRPGFYGQAGWSTPRQIGEWRRKVDDKRRLGSADPAPAVDGPDRIVGRQGEDVPAHPRATPEEVRYWREQSLQTELEDLQRQLRESKVLLSASRGYAQELFDLLREIDNQLVDSEFDVDIPAWIFR